MKAIGVGSLFALSLVACKNNKTSEVSTSAENTVQRSASMKVAQAIQCANDLIEASFATEHSGRMPIHKFNWDGFDVIEFYNLKLGDYYDIYQRGEKSYIVSYPNNNSSKSMRLFQSGRDAHYFKYYPDSPSYLVSPEKVQVGDGMITFKDLNGQSVTLPNYISTSVIESETLMELHSEFQNAVKSHLSILREGADFARDILQQDVNLEKLASIEERCAS